MTIFQRSSIIEIIINKDKSSRLNILKNDILNFIYILSNICVYIINVFFYVLCLCILCFTLKLSSVHTDKSTTLNYILRANGIHSSSHTILVTSLSNPCRNLLTDRDNIVSGVNRIFSIEGFI